MFNKISSRIQCPEWWKKDRRYWRLECLDRLLEGTFYDHLPHSFYTEVEGSGGMERMIPMEDRRPAVQYGLAGMVARMTARKLFSGRHVPRIRHKDKETAKNIRRIVRNSKLYQHMMDITVRGSVGAVAATFAVHGDTRKPKVKITTWKAKFCTPSFDENGDLDLLRVQYVTSAKAMADLGATGLDEGKMYWFIREWTAHEQITFLPIEKDDWNPVDGWRNEDAKATGFRVWDDHTERHDFGFVPAQWFKNLAGGEGVDGSSTWGPAANTAIDLDYTLSQIGRGVRYNAAPQLVVIGAPNALGGANVPVDEDGGAPAMTRDPLTYIGLSAGFKNEDGETVGAGDAKLLEMTGTGIEAGLKYTDMLRKVALEQIQAARKDPEQMKGPMSGRAMEYLDDDWHDLVMELRSSYGENGALPMLKKMIMAIGSYSGSNQDPNVEGLGFRWPRLFQPTPVDIGQIMPAFAIAVNPMKAQPKAPAIPGGEGGGGGTPAMPGPDEEDAFMTAEQVRNWLKDNMDLGLYDEDDDEDEDDDTETEDREVRLPTPDPNGGGVDDDETPPAQEPVGDPLAALTAGGVHKVTAGSPS